MDSVLCENRIEFVAFPFHYLHTLRLRDVLRTGRNVRDRTRSRPFSLRTQQKRCILRLLGLCACSFGIAELGRGFLTAGAVQDEGCSSE